MPRYCVNLCITVLLSLHVKNINGQTETISNTTQLSTNIKPVINNKEYKTEGFNSDVITSGPVVIIDKKTMFISNVNYKSIYKDAHFWVGVGEPSSNGSLVPDENNSKNPLKSYSGQNIYLQLPENLTTDKIDYIALWSIETKTDLGHIVLYKNVSNEVRNNVPEALGYHKKTKDNKIIFRIPFCCEVNEIYTGDPKRCTPVQTDLGLNLTVFDSNETHLDPDHILDNIEFAPYTYFLNCSTEDFNSIILGPEEIIGLIYNSSLLYYFDPKEYGILAYWSFCVVYPKIDRQGIAACIKKESNTVSAGIQHLYAPFLIISTICFLGSAAVYIFILKPKDVHRKCFVGYSLSMVVTFVTLLCLHEMNSACYFMGGLFMFSMMNSFVWLSCLCIDMIFIVKSPNQYEEDHSRIYIYLSISLVFSVVVLSSSVIPNGIPDVPSSFVKGYSGTCDFGEVNLALFFVPIGLLIVVSVIGLSYTSYIINTHKDPEDYDWLHNKSRFKFMLRSCFLVWITTFIWLIDALANVIVMGTAIQYAIDLIEALQGIFVMIIFVLNKYVRKEIRSIIFKKENIMEQEMRYLDLLRTLDKPNNTCETETSAKTKDS